jgi:ATP synthase protein I
MPIGFTAWGLAAAGSALLGGFICLIPNAYFAFRMFRYTGARAARQIVRSFYAAEVSKLMLTAIFFGVAFATIDALVAPALFLGFIAVQLVNWLAPLLMRQ